MKNKTVLNWTKELASKEGKYTAGSAVSVVAAISASLAGFILNLQAGKDKYRDREAQIQKSIQKSSLLNQELLELSEKDANAFAPVIPLYALPENTKEEKKLREKEINEALIDASKPPFEMILKIDETLDLYKELIDLELEGTILEDITIGLDIAIAALKSAKVSSMINIKEITNEKLKKDEMQVIKIQFQKTLEKAESLLEISER